MEAATQIEAIVRVVATTRTKRSLHLQWPHRQLHQAARTKTATKALTSEAVAVTNIIYYTTTVGAAGTTAATRDTSETVVAATAAIAPTSDAWELRS